MPYHPSQQWGQTSYSYEGYSRDQTQRRSPNAFDIQELLCGNIFVRRHGLLRRTREVSSSEEGAQTGHSSDGSIQRERLWCKNAHDLI